MGLVRVFWRLNWGGEWGILCSCSWCCLLFAFLRLIKVKLTRKHPHLVVNLFERVTLVLRGIKFRSSSTAMDFLLFRANLICSDAVSSSSFSYWVPYIKGSSKDANKTNTSTSVDSPEGPLQTNELMRYSQLTPGFFADPLMLNFIFATKFHPLLIKFFVVFQGGGRWKLFIGEFQRFIITVRNEKV